jgi:hypothetical protein
MQNASPEFVKHRSYIPAQQEVCTLGILLYGLYNVDPIDDWRDCVTLDIEDLVQTNRPVLGYSHVSVNAEWLVKAMLQADPL